MRERRSLREIYEDVDRLMVRQGYANRHRAYPFGVIAHKIDRVKERRWSPTALRLRHPVAQGPGERRAARPPGRLVAAVEPVHVLRPPAAAGPVGGRAAPRFRGTGAKFEEILVVTDSRDPEQSAFWLDDDLPHVRRWAEDACGCGMGARKERRGLEGCAGALGPYGRDRAVRRRAGRRDRPTVVLVHGYPDSKEVWSEVAGRLADRFHVVLYDVRGHGRSTAPAPLRGGFTLEKLTDDFLAVADAVSPDRPVHLVGHDWGRCSAGSSPRSQRTEGRIASFTSMSGPVPRPLRALDQEADDAGPRPRRVGQLLGQGAKSWYVYMLHTPVLPELAWRGPLGKQWPKILQRVEKLPAGGYPTPSLPHDAAHGAWLYRDNVRARLRRPRADAYAHVPVQLITPTGDAFLSERLYDELGGGPRS